MSRTFRRGALESLAVVAALTLACDMPELDALGAGIKAMQHAHEDEHARAMSCEFREMAAAGGLLCSESNSDGWHSCNSADDRQASRRGDASTISGLIVRTCGDTRTDGRGFDLSDGRVCLDIESKELVYDPYKTGGDHAGRIHFEWHNSWVKP